jgi:hypothetical protein
MKKLHPLVESLLSDRFNNLIEATAMSDADIEAWIDGNMPTSTKEEKAGIRAKLQAKRASKEKPTASSERVSDPYADYNSKARQRAADWQAGAEARAAKGPKQTSSKPATSAAPKTKVDGMISRAKSVVRGPASFTTNLGTFMAGDYLTQQALEKAGVENETAKGIGGAIGGGVAGELTGAATTTALGGVATPAIGTGVAGLAATGALVGLAAYGGAKAGEAIADIEVNKKTGETVSDVIGQELYNKGWKGGPLSGAVKSIADWSVGNQFGASATESPKGKPGGDPALKAKWDAAQAEEDERQKKMKAFEVANKVQKISEGVGDAIVKGVLRALEGGMAPAAETAAKQIEKQLAKKAAQSAESQIAKTKSVADIFDVTTSPLARVTQSTEKTAAKQLSPEIEQSIKDAISKNLSDSDVASTVIDTHKITDADEIQKVIDKVIKTKTETALVTKGAKEINVEQPKTTELAVQSKELAVPSKEISTEVKVVPTELDVVKNQIVPKPATEVVTKPVTDIVPKPATEVVTKPVTDIVPKPATEVVTKPKTDIVTKTKDEIVTKPEPKIEEPVKPGETTPKPKRKFRFFGADVGKKAKDMGMYDPKGSAILGNVGLGATQLGRYSTLFQQR